MRLGALISVVLACAAPAAASELYRAPTGCEPIATLRLPDCQVRQVASCPSGNIVDSYVEGVYTGRSFYGHPSLFLRFESVFGAVTGHRYGPGAPAPGAVLAPGDRFSYTRDVYRTGDEAKPGDTGVEEMDVNAPAAITIGGRRLGVLDIRFRVTNEAGYLYRERALMVRDPAFTLGVIGSVRETADGPTESFSTIPEAVSLPGDPDFRGFDPAPSCLPTS